jgi:hypothetical protein
MLGRLVSQVLASTDSKYGFNTMYTIQVTPKCAICKAKQEILDKSSSNLSAELGGGINIDRVAVHKLYVAADS